MVNSFIENPILINGKIISNYLHQFKIDFSELIIDENIDKRKVQIYKLIGNYEITFHKRKLSLIKKNVTDKDIYSNNILQFNKFEKSLEMDNQENFINLKKNIVLVFNKTSNKLECLYYLVKA